MTLAHRQGGKSNPVHFPFDSRFVSTRGGYAVGYTCLHHAYPHMPMRTHLCFPSGSSFPLPVRLLLLQRYSSFVGVRVSSGRPSVDTKGIFRVKEFLLHIRKHSAEERGGLFLKRRHLASVSSQPGYVTRALNLRVTRYTESYRKARQIRHTRVLFTAEVLCGRGH